MPFGTRGRSLDPTPRLSLQPSFLCSGSHSYMQGTHSAFNLLEGCINMGRVITVTERKLRGRDLGVGLWQDCGICRPVGCGYFCEVFFHA